MVKKDILRPVRRILLSAFILLVLFMGAGVAYVYYTGGHPKPAQNATPPKPVTDVNPLPKPVLPGPNAAEGVAVEFITSPVAPGANATINVHTNATSTCTIAVTYNNKPSKDSGLIAKKADAYGNISWTWTIDPAAPVGKWPATVTCVYNKKSGVAIGYVQVNR